MDYQCIVGWYVVGCWFVVVLGFMVYVYGSFVFCVVVVVGLLRVFRYVLCVLFCFGCFYFYCCVWVLLLMVVVISLILCGNWCVQVLLCDQCGVVFVEFVLVFLFGMLFLLMFIFFGVLIFVVRQLLILVVEEGVRVVLCYGSDVMCVIQVCQVVW